MLLKAATFVPGDAGLVASDRNLNVRIEQQVQELRSRYLSVRVTVNTDGRATALYATGYVPNYDDIESVSSTSGVTTGDTYSVTGWQSSASADQLREAPASTPSYIRDRYLGLPDSVTDETRGLALSITQGTDTVFDTALAIQTYLRATYPYEESISGPSDGVDAVHYFLFDEQQGYCEYFASAMVVMLRSLDIPTRLVSGLMEVPYDADQGWIPLFAEAGAHLGRGLLRRIWLDRV
ncbi:MAG: transglutaminase-like domain-containing protein [Thermomicrobiales bacterium]